MKHPFLILSILLLLCSCKSKEIEIEDFTSHLGLQELYDSDQADRKTLKLDWSIRSLRDKQRRERVYELLDSNKVVTSDDFANAAMIFQHGTDTITSGMAIKMMRQAVALDSTRNKRWLAAAIDRDLMFKDKPQIYGTQFTKNPAGGQWEMYDLDETKISDMERRAYGVGTLLEQKEKIRKLNEREKK